MFDAGSALEHAVVFERALGPRLLSAERFVLSWPQLFDTLIQSVDVAVRTEGPLFLAIARLNAARWGPESVARFRFWADRAGGAEVALSDLGLRQRANFLSRFERCEHRKAGIALADMGAAFDGIFGSLGVTRTPAAGKVQPELELDLADARVCTYDVATRGLFVASPLVPPLGDTLQVRLKVPGSGEAFAVAAKVTHARPPGFGLTALDPPAQMLEAIGALRANPKLAERPASDRRSAARHAIKAPVVVSVPPGVVRQTYASPQALLKDYVENLSVGGAFIRTEHPAPLRTAVTLEIDLLNGEVLRAPGTVVNVMAAGMGIQFTLEPAAKAHLADSITRLVAAQRLPAEPELFTVQYPSAEQMAAELPTLLGGGIFLPTDRELPLQTEVRVALSLPDGAEFQLRGRVICTEPAGLGVQVTLEPWNRKRLEEALAAISPPSFLDVSQISLVELIEDPPAAVPHVSHLSLLDLVTEPPAESPAQPHPTLGNYELLSLLGQGGMAEVFYARALSGPRAGTFAAVKRLSAEMLTKPDAVELFMSEVDILRMLDHPNVVKTLEIGTFGTHYYLVMEAIDGRNLGQILRRCRERKIFLPVDLACFIVKALLDGLDCVHRAKSRGGVPLNLVHCDVSPDNLFISRDGELKLGDFGLAQSARPAEPGARVSGKPAYLSPEALDGDVSVGRDLWAVAVTLYELLTLAQPFQGPTIQKQLEAIRRGKWAPVETLRPGLSPDLCAVLRRAFEKKPAQRFASARDFAAALTPHIDANVGTSLAIAAVVRGLFGQASAAAA